MSVKICGIGDIMLGENEHHYRRGIATRYHGKFQRLIPPAVTEAVNLADIVVGNLECSLIPDHALLATPFSRAIYAGPESALDCFMDWKPCLVLNVANNHFGQHGAAAMEYTLRCLGARGIHFIGRERAPLQLNIRQKQIFLWGASIVEDPHGKAGYVQSSAKELVDVLEWGEKPEGAYWILCIHWGKEYFTQPSDVQRRLAEDLVTKGVDLILGHHPHVIQPVRHVGNVPVAFSLGNFIFDQNFSKLTRTGLMILSELGGKAIHLYKLFSRHYQIVQHHEISPQELEYFCTQNMKSYNSSLMRILMKIELLTKFHEVPSVVWQHFLARIVRRVLGFV